MPTFLPPKAKTIPSFTIEFTTVAIMIQYMAVSSVIFTVTICDKESVMASRYGKV